MDKGAGTSGKLGPGALVLVVGPSGVGKDTLLTALKERLQGNDEVVFARRAITREADENSEDHATLSMDAFSDLVALGEVALSWEAHGLGYVLPKTYDADIQAGKTVIANGSRRALRTAQEKYAHFKVLLITAPIPVLAERLAARGRETRSEIEQRLSHADMSVEPEFDLVEIENTGPIEAGVDRILSALKIG
ncbi:phosphonate metabolism protein/1,5-bisphosphokinase (prpp-forming) phnn [Roseibium sp. TrichSKD4]|uniref:phosphonate metabolism protein/1,5-bisphosphokinase (PRPP-forming) PhnN n=1 Tax=Roseibium sp. TrichSKD4 TaxID=744980 RepID=UPI0001E56896|nr:phosphonate metabolism protein/1,5-bisphosphokinase (PRPP-forming) PhnN [Roseibium sp. TrichSKD4]EFO32429.1 phosphonate metabolism protein/1,5-bisphosphokinase (prpp-forming) phnn [Roseibium sp. TrichSKD4]